MEANFYDLFEEGPRGWLWRREFADLPAAKREGQKMADAENLIFLVISQRKRMEVARFKPHTKPAARQARSLWPSLFRLLFSK